MELAGLEPATSWVRSRRKPSPPIAIVAIGLNPAGAAPGTSRLIASASHGYLTKT